MYKTLLLAVDVNDTEGAVRVTEAAVGLAVQEGAVLHVLNVVPDQGMSIVSASMAEDHGSATKEAAKAELDRWIADSIKSDVALESHVAMGTVYDQIIKIADHLDVDCILVGAHSPTLKDYLIGPNAARVARHSSKSVFVVR